MNLQRYCVCVCVSKENAIHRNGRRETGSSEGDTIFTAMPERLFNEVHKAGVALYSTKLPTLRGREAVRDIA